jgi:hypothetical protein
MSMDRIKVAEYLSANKLWLAKLGPKSKVPVGGKTWKIDDKALEKGQQKHNSEVVAHAKKGGNVAIALTGNMMVMDIDPRNDPAVENGEREKWNIDEKNSPADMFFQVCDMRDWKQRLIWTKTPGGGAHIFFNCPEDLMIGLPKLDGTHGFIEFKWPNLGYVVAPGSYHPDPDEEGKHKQYELILPTVEDEFDGLYSFQNLPDLFPEVVRLIEQVWTRHESAEGVQGSNHEPGGTHSASEIETILDGVKAEDFQDHSVWLPMMQGVHHATNGCPEAMAVFVEWSTSDPAYAGREKAIEKRYQSLGKRATGRKVTIGTVFHLLNEKGYTGRGGPSALEREADLAKFDGDSLDKEAELPKGAVTEDPLQEFFAEWVFVADSMQFIRRADHKRFNVEQFNAMYGDLAKGNPATEVVKGRTRCKKFESLVFIPGSPEVVGKGRSKSYNLWRPSAAKPIKGDVSLLEAHFELLLPNPAERSMMLDYLHYVVCKPEMKLLFALLLQGKHGTGKSIIGSLARRAIGPANVVCPSNKEVTSQWTAWQEGASLAIIEELMTNGRLEVANSLKTVITDETLRIEDKKRSIYSIPNHLNLLTFTNHKNAVRLEEGDRRWLVLFSPMARQEKAYYAKLWNWANRPEAPGEFYYWLSQREPKLDPKSVAPHTEAKDRMMESSRTDVEMAVKELFDSGAFPFNHELVRYDDVRNKVMGSRPHHSSVSSAMENLGMVRHNRSTNKTSEVPAIQLWSTANHEAWEAMGPTKRVKAYLEMLGLTAEEFSDFHLSN